jgi:hypothetical protein
VLLTFGVLILLFRSRVRMVREGLAPVSYFRTFQGSIETPEYSAKPNRHFANLFEAPLSFMPAAWRRWSPVSPGTWVVVLAWAYVAMRYLHAFIHLGGNRVRHRLRAYFVGWICLLALWITVAVGVRRGTRRAENFHASLRKQRYVHAPSSCGPRHLISNCRPFASRLIPLHV